MSASQLDPAGAGAARASPSTWKLVAPDWSALDTVWHNRSPFVLWAVGHQPLLAHWMDEAVRRGIEVVELYVADRPAEVRAWLNEGAYWSRRVRLVAIAADERAPEDAERIDHLPGLEAPPFPQTPAELPGYWFELQKQWLAHRSPETVTIDHRHPSGGWVGPRTKIHPSARLTAPFWIGARAQILDRNVQVEEACVLPRTYLGANTRLFQSAAAGNVLLDFRRGCRAEIEEPFIMAAIVERSLRPRVISRLLALLCWLALTPIGRFCARGGCVVRRIRWQDGTTCDLATGRRGPLWLRRVSWLRHIAADRMRWIGILPRGLDELAHVPEEIARELRKAPAGMFSLADVYGCADPGDPEEWVHAVYQACPAGRDAAATVRRNLWKIAWSHQTDSPPE